MTVEMPRPAQGPPARMLTLPGVYVPQYDTQFLMAALDQEEMRPGSDVLDLGTGSGALAVRAAQLGGRVTAVDIAWRAVITARLNAFLCRQRVTVRRGDLTASVSRRSYDIVLSNPPYVPAPSGLPPGRGQARSWDAGGDGRALVDRICDVAPAVVRPQGVLLLVHSDLCGTEATLRRLSLAGMRATVSERALVPFGPVLRSRLPWLRERGLIADSQDREELVIIRAEHA
ncbi:methyltransferase [Streptomyces sp. SID13666]|uniref:HemK2/MTQ2 family protein methyltransferase n=2 Tax=Streptomyces TaxID=1883 RepID=UPI001106C195|nr:MULTISPECIES: HemK2/MTQ2 family protein methyltransferase [unclassified Streptomyces]MCZ4095352.1 class I SAM-dependent methyltransferase [Streptomyces sp. H39-C1]NEA53025.1 methyltransferase [Streptomyces sp. SID13666]NEA69648.1 methyltransferase [Streptomyces sp. SID13588]QNA71070.1 methyltransferase [Streptomyces sp. So13.3]